MRVVSAAQVDRLLDYPALIAALRDGFATGVVAPTRHHHALANAAGAAGGTLLLMPAWSRPDDRSAAQRFLGVKIVTVHPQNNDRGEPAVRGVFFLADAETGAPLALIDAEALTAWRTACASALAASFLARADAADLVVIGAGRLAPHLVRAHASVRPVRRVSVWNRTPERAAALASRLSAEGFAANAVTDREAAVRRADIVTCATIADRPLVEGAWLKAGAHLDLVGAFTPALRESDDAAVQKAALFVDTFDGAVSEAGDLAQPIAAGIIAASDIRADLAMLCRADHPGRTAEDEITLFKSTGTALEDLVAGALVYRRAAD